MKTKLKQFIIPFILMMVTNLFTFLLDTGYFGIGLTLHAGLIPISGLIFGPYGAIGLVIANTLCDFIRGYKPSFVILTEIITFAVACLAYKLWYHKFPWRKQLTKPRLNSVSNIVLFLFIILLCDILFSILVAKSGYLTYPDERKWYSNIMLEYFLNFFNASFIFGILGMWLSKKISFTYLPKPHKSKPRNIILSHIIYILLIIFSVTSLLLDYIFPYNTALFSTELIITFFLVFVFIFISPNVKLYEINYTSITEKIMDRFFLINLILVIIGILLSINIFNIDYSALDALLNVDLILIIFFIPSLFVLHYIERKVINPIKSFSKINDFIKENEKIESEGLLNIYSDYLNEDNEVGLLANSYSDLIKHNNYYIENIQEIEGEKERIKTELSIAERIQQANLPTEAVDNEYYTVNGYSHPAKEVGGDFFDYYSIDDDNLAIIIGDASGKGVPAALLATITQAIIQQLLHHDSNPSNILYSLNNQLCENNTEVMFITLWLGIYNKKTKKLTFSNAGHNPPLIKENNEFKYLKIDEGIVLGIMEDYEFKNEEIILDDEIVIYTDGITDANNADNKMYGEDNLLRFFNNFQNDRDPIRPLLEDIKYFTGDCEQFDDMTLLYLKIK